jgi:hypothetical protein
MLIRRKVSITAKSDITSNTRAIYFNVVTSFNGNENIIVSDPKIFYRRVGIELNNSVNILVRLAANSMR